VTEFRDRLSQRLAAELALAPVPERGGSPAWDVLYRRERDLILTVGTQLSVNIDEQYTCAAYLAPSFHWGFTPKGFPPRAYRRLGTLLQPVERRNLLGEEFWRPGVTDAWWRGFTDDALQSCVQAAAFTLPRFLAQPGLFDELRGSPPLQTHARMLREIPPLATTLDRPPPRLRHQPGKLAGVPDPWVWAAEVVAQRHRPDLASPRYTALVARDAFLMATLP
jgi:hypothetical protein